MDASRFLEEQERRREEIQIPRNHFPNRLTAKQGTLEGEFVPKNLNRAVSPQKIPNLTPTQESYLRDYLDGTPLKEIAEKYDVDTSNVSAVLTRIKKAAGVPRGARMPETKEFLQKLLLLFIVFQSLFNLFNGGFS